ncbi:MAG: EF-P 5-aminopentanol modification-associated protein YfmF [Terrisporobacter sp.]|uniref:EF-P 5-aminopentanol modification-associated protein YfmF n=1 Tax=Terrisporobacter sp. TaxID=1965305 RepID=UPI0025E7EF42|nr:pitrilysin family protein [uncultured Terrisporobacter sp.]
MKNNKTINLGKGINLTLIPEEKFKSNLVSIYIQRILDRDEVTMNALLPSIIKSGSEKYPSAREMSYHQDDLYGVSIGADSSKRGESQVITFKIISTDEEYLDEQIFKKVVKYLDEVVNHPLVIDGGFKEEYVAIEKENLKNRIESIINDKGRYAVERAREEMFKNEKYGISDLGYLEDIDKITAKGLYEHYVNIMKTSPIDIVVEGNFDEDEIVEIISNGFDFHRENIIEIPRADFIKKVDEIKVIKEEMDITQGKLVMGYRCNVDYKDEFKYYSLFVGSNVLGGGPHSKLFVNVREKESLCYYIYSSLEKYKTSMFISSGIESENYDKTVELIGEQLKSLKEGKISDEELLNSKSAIISSLKTIKDSLGGSSDFYFSQSMGETNTTVEKIIEMIEKVTVSDIVEAFKNIELDTIYFLSNNKEA